MLSASEQVPTPSMVTASRSRGLPNFRTVSMPSDRRASAVSASIDSQSGRSARPAGAGLVPGPGPDAGADAGLVERLEDGGQVVAAGLLEQGRAEADHLRRRVPGQDVHVLLGQRRERRVDEPAQRLQGGAALGHRALGAAQQVTVPVGHAGDDDRLRLVDQRRRAVGGEDRRPLADLDDDAVGDGDRAVAVDLPRAVERDDPGAGDDRVDRHRRLGLARLTRSHRPCFLAVGRVPEHPLVPGRRRGSAAAPPPRPRGRGSRPTWSVRSSARSTSRR